MKVFNIYENNVWLFFTAKSQGHARLAALFTSLGQNRYSTSFRFTIYLYLESLLLTMNRRLALKNLMLASGGLIALPAWAGEWSASDIADHSPSFSAKEQQTLAAVADTIIPAGNSIGALTVGVDKFLQKLIDNCYEKEVQSNTKQQLIALDVRAQQLHGKIFANCSQQQREEMLLKLGASQEKTEKDFFTLVKNETIRGFNTSKEVMVKYLKYEIAPGHYYGCVNVKA
jgi:hypothetical protein